MAYDYFRLQLGVKYITLLLGLFSTGISVLFYLYASDSPKVEVAMAIAAAGIALTALIYAAMNVHLLSESQQKTIEIQRQAITIQQQAIKLQQQTYEFQEADRERRKKEYSSRLILDWNNPEITKLTIIAKALKTDLQDLNPKEVATFLKSDPDKQRAVLLVLNFLENLALAIKHDLADDGLLREYFLDIVKVYYYNLQTYIQAEINAYNSDNIFIEFRRLVGRWGQLPKDSNVHK